FFGGANAWFDSLLGKASDGINSATNAASAADAVTAATGAATSVADVVTSATGAATSAADAVTAATGAASEAAASVGTVIMNWDIFGFLNFIFVSGKSLAESNLADYAFKVDILVMNWFINTFIMPYDWVQVAMQAFIVSAEILIGL